jgi:hypothetical protein
MRRLTICLTALLIPLPLVAQDAKHKEPAPLNLPISVDKIREGLSQPAPAEQMKGLAAAEQPTFRVNVTEQQKFEELLAKIRWEPAGPRVAGGIYAYEQQERLFPRINNPRVQPYSAFTSGEVATLAVEALIEKYVADKMAHVVGTALREQAEREAREEVGRALAEYRTAQPAAAPPAPASKE